MERISYQDVPQGMFEKLRAIENFIKESTLEPQLVELLKLRISQINGCAYCVDMHHKDLKHAGETELRLSSLVVWKETPYFTNKEEAVLAFAEALTIIGHEPFMDELFNPLLNYFSKKEISYISLAIAQINTWNRLMKAFGFVPGKYKVKKKEVLEAV